MARFDGQRFGKLKAATWNVRGIAEKTEELKTDLLKRKIDIAIITNKEEKQRIRRHRQLCDDLLWGTSQPLDIIWSSNCN